MTWGIIIATADAAARYDSAIRFFIGATNGEIVAENRLYLSPAQKNELRNLGVPSNLLGARLHTIAFKGPLKENIKLATVEGVHVAIGRIARELVRKVFCDFHCAFAE